MEASVSARRIEDISDTIGAIYDCALDPAGWPDTLEAICASMAFSTPSLVLQKLPSWRPLLYHSGGIAPENLVHMLTLGPQVVGHGVTDTLRGPAAGRAAAN